MIYSFCFLGLGNSIQMTSSERDKCGISSILPLSCREHAEAFAKHLNARLQKLGSQDGTLINNETSWSKEHEHDPVAVSQPKPIDGDVYYEFGILDSPGSPAEVKSETEITKLINNDDIARNYNTEVFRSEISNSLDSELSDGPYFDLDDKVLLVNTVDDIDFIPSNLLNDVCIEKTDESVNHEDDNKISTKLPELIVEKVLVDDDDDDETLEIPRVRRCSSLKTGKTPPGTPGRKKIVRFADVLGLDLADVRTYLDEIPKIPNSAYSDLTCIDLSSSYSSTSLSSLLGNNNQTLTKILIPMFQQPGGQPDFLDRVKEKLVCLENVMVEDPVSFAIKGTVRVRNLDFNKSVHVRYTLDSWKNYSDLQTIYVQNSCDGFSDKFSFLLYAHTLHVGQRLEFAIRFQCKGCQYWDNNFGVNYCFQCLPVSNNNNTSSSSYQQTVLTDDDFGAAFY